MKPKEEQFPTVYIAQAKSQLPKNTTRKTHKTRQIQYYHYY